MEWSYQIKSILGSPSRQLRLVYYHLGSNKLSNNFTRFLGKILSQNLDLKGLKNERMKLEEMVELC
jgi:hypothetical protein